MTTYTVEFILLLPTKLTTENSLLYNSIEFSSELLLAVISVPKSYFYFLLKKHSNIKIKHQIGVLKTHK